jgi:hypothetical protein
MPRGSAARRVRRTAVNPSAHGSGDVLCASVVQNVDMRFARSTSIVLISAALLSTGCARTPVSVSIQQARAFFDDLTEYAFDAAPTIDSEAFCARWAANQTFCLQSLEAWSESGRQFPSAGSLTSEIERLSTNSKRVRVEGEYPDGTRFTSAIEVLRDHEGHIRAVDPTFWIPRTIGRSTPLEQ